jgi:hypothetical protein
MVPLGGNTSASSDCTYRGQSIRTTCLNAHAPATQELGGKNVMGITHPVIALKLRQQLLALALKLQGQWSGSNCFSKTRGAAWPSIICHLDCLIDV